MQQKLFYAIFISFLVNAASVWKHLIKYNLSPMMDAKFDIRNVYWHVLSIMGQK